MKVSMDAKDRDTLDMLSYHIGLLSNEALSSIIAKLDYSEYLHRKAIEDLQKRVALLESK
jgi:hypothetical protein